MRNLSILSSTDANALGHGYVFGIDDDANTLCDWIEVYNPQPIEVSNGLSAHIHARSSGR